MIDTVRINAVDSSLYVNGRTVYRIHASNGAAYATRSMFAATLCRRAMTTNASVTLHHRASGNSYRDITHVELVPVEVAS